MAALIDCHILTLPRFRAQWIAELRQDLDNEPLNQHWMEGVEGDLGMARAAGYATGSAPFVTSADPDDRILPGTFAALHEALINNPRAPFAWAGEQLVGEDLAPWDVRPNVWPGGYSPFLHLTRGTHGHGVKLSRRELVMTVLTDMMRTGLCCEFLLDYALARPHTNPAPSTWPVHVPMVGRLWRQHDHNGSKSFQVSDFDRMARVLGFDSMQAVRAASIDHGYRATKYVSAASNMVL